MNVLKKIRQKISSRAKYTYQDSLHALGKDDHALRSAKGSCILVYHGIDEIGNRKYNTRFISQKQLASHLKAFQEYFDIVTVKDIVLGNIDPDHFSIALTFDDGYLNNLTHALPVLETFQVPATFCITAIAATDMPVLWTDLIDVSAREERFLLDLRDSTYQSSRKYPWSNYAYYDDRGTDLKFMSSRENQSFKDLLYKQIGGRIDWKKWESNWPYWKQLSEAEIKKLASSPGMEIASHGYYHNNLGDISPEDALWEMKASKAFLEEVIQKSVDTLAYPEGSYSSACINLAKEAGYQLQLAAGFQEEVEIPEGSPIFDRFTINPYISTYNQLLAIVKQQYY